MIVEVLFRVLKEAALGLESALSGLIGADWWEQADDFVGEWGIGLIGVASHVVTAEARVAAGAALAAWLSAYAVGRVLRLVRAVRDWAP